MKRSKSLVRAISLLCRPLLLALLVMALGAAVANAKTIRLLSYNIDSADQGSDNNITGPTHSLTTVIQGIALHHLGTNVQPVDVMGLEELSSTTLSNLVVQLTNIYGAGSYAYDTTADPTTGGGTDGLVYKTSTIQLISARALKTGQNVLLQSNGVYTNAYFFSATYTSNGITRAPLVYQLRPVGFSAANDFYLYVSHARAGDNSVGDARYAEAQSVRSDAKYNLPAGAHIIYSGDWNLSAGSRENAYKCLTGQTTSDGINWSDSGAVWANTNQTQACDPMSKTVPPTTVIWSNTTADNATWLYGDSTSSPTTQNTSRIDIQLMNRPMFAAYNSSGGVQIAPDTADPYDSSNFPASQYPYAFETFGNNGSLPRLTATTNAANHALDDLTNTVPNAATVYASIQLIGSGANFTGSDHYPNIADYNIVVLPPATPVLTSLGFTNGNYKLKLASTTNTTFGIQGSTNLLNWINLGSGTTDTNGVFFFQDTNTANVRFRFYRAYWPYP